MRAVLALAALVALLAAAAPPAAAQPAPRTVRLVYPFPPGGSDGIVRLYAEHLAQSIGQPVVVDNRGGAGGNIGADIVAKAAPDGTTLLVGTNGPLAINPGLYPSMPFDPQRDFVPIGGLVAAPQVLVVPADSPVATLQDLIKLAKAKPGTLTYGSVGQGSASHLTVELMKSLTGTDITHVPYKGAGPALTDLLAGRLSMMTVIAGSVVPHIKAGKLRPIAITSATRSVLVPGVPTMAEAGVPGLEAIAWLAVVAPTGTPRDVTTRIGAATQRFLADPEVKARLLDLGFEPAPWTADELAERLKRERAQWAQVIKTTGTRIE
jgi:tripartite-type tricarboxylate transporter receptor subunit TctC